MENQAALVFMSSSLGTESPCSCQTPAAAQAQLASNAKDTFAHKVKLAKGLRWIYDQRRGRFGYNFNYCCL